MESDPGKRVSNIHLTGSSVRRTKEQLKLPRNPLQSLFPGSFGLMRGLDSSSVCLFLFSWSLSTCPARRCGRAHPCQGASSGALNERYLCFQINGRHYDPQALISCVAPLRAEVSGLGWGGGGGGQLQINAGENSAERPSAALNARYLSNFAALHPTR